MIAAALLAQAAGLGCSGDEAIVNRTEEQAVSASAPASMHTEDVEVEEDRHGYRLRASFDDVDDERDVHVVVLLCDKPRESVDLPLGSLGGCQPSVAYHETPRDQDGEALDWDMVTHDWESSEGNITVTLGEDVNEFALEATMRPSTFVLFATNAAAGTFQLTGVVRVDSLDP